MSSSSSIEPFDQLVLDLQNNASLRTKLAGSILSSLYFKTRYYQEAYLKKAGEIIRQDQPRMIKHLCQMGQVKPEIEYEEKLPGQPSEYYSMTIPRRTRTNLRTKEITSFGEDEYQVFVASRVGYGDMSLFELETQCDYTPPSAVVYNWQERISAAPTRQEMMARTVRTKHISLPNGITIQQIEDALSESNILTSYQPKVLQAALIKGGLYEQVLALGNKKNPNKAELIAQYEELMGGDRDLAMALAHILAGHPEGTRPEDDLKEEARPSKGPTAITPDYADLKTDLNFYTAALNEREELQVLVDILKSQFDHLYTYRGSLDSLAKAGSSRTEPELEMTPSLVRSNAMDDRLSALVESLRTFRAEIQGSSRKPIRDDLTRLIRSFINNWRGFASSYLNGVLLGPPGSGKTETARYVGQILSRLGILGRGEFQTHSRATLVGQYIGETALKVRRILVGSLENVLFVDEAYSLTQVSPEQQDGKGRAEFDPYGVEAINEIVGFLDKYRGKSCLIAAGYACEMEKYWFGVNPGLRRRVRFIWTMPDLSTDEFFDLVRKNVEAWKAQNRSLCRTAQCDRETKVEGTSPLLASYQVGQHLWGLLEQFKPLLVNQGGDAEMIADGLISRYYETDMPLTQPDVNQIVYSFLEGRPTVMSAKEPAKGCVSKTDEDRSRSIRSAVCALLPGGDPRRASCR